VLLRAVAVGFEPTEELPPHTLSSSARPSERLPEGRSRPFAVVHTGPLTWGGATGRPAVNGGVPG
jgi:hypothetical protein